MTKTRYRVAALIAAAALSLGACTNNNADVAATPEPSEQVTTGPTEEMSECEALVKTASEVPLDQVHDSELVASIRGCDSYEEWEEHVHVYPDIVGLAEGWVIEDDDIEIMLYSICADEPDLPVCVGSPYDWDSVEPRNPVDPDPTDEPSDPPVGGDRPTNSPFEQVGMAECMPMLNAMMEVGSHANNLDDFSNPEQMVESYQEVARLMNSIEPLPGVEGDLWVVQEFFNAYAENLDDSITTETEAQTAMIGVLGSLTERGLGINDGMDAMNNIQMWVEEACV